MSQWRLLTYHWLKNLHALNLRKQWLSERDLSTHEILDLSFSECQTQTNIENPFDNISILHAFAGCCTSISIMAYRPFSWHYQRTSLSCAWLVAVRQPNKCQRICLVTFHAQRWEQNLHHYCYQVQTMPRKHTLSDPFFTEFSYKSGWKIDVHLLSTC